MILLKKLAKVQRYQKSHVKPVFLFGMNYYSKYTEVLELKNKVILIIFLDSNVIYENIKFYKILKFFNHF